MPQSEQSFLKKFKKQINELERKNRTLNESYANLQRKYERTKMRESALYQEMFEWKNKNPFKMNQWEREEENKQMKETYSELKQKFEKLKEREIQLLQEIKELKSNNPYKMEGESEFESMPDIIKEKEVLFRTIEESVANQSDTALNIKVNYSPLIQLLDDLISDLQKEARNQDSTAKKMHYDAMGNIEVASFANGWKIELDNLRWSVPNEQKEENGKEKESNMDKKEKIEGSAGEKEPKIQDEADFSKVDSKTIEGLKKEINELKELLKGQKETEEMKPAAEQEGSMAEKSIWKEQQKITFRDIQNAETVNSMPLKKTRTRTNIRRSINNHLKHSKSSGSGAKIECEKAESKTGIRKPSE